MTKSELVFVSAYLLKTQIESLSDESLLAMDQTIEKVFFRKEALGSLNVFEMQMSRNSYLLEMYKQTFLPDNLVMTLSQFFNQRPAESSVAMYKLLLIVLSSP